MNNSQTPLHLDWLKKVERDISEDYQRLHNVAQEDPQQSGHGGESTWARFLEEWLPPAYTVGTRKYIIPELGDEKFETDLVIFRPSYPEALRSREEIMAGGVAAAFSVKLTLDAGGLRDGIERAAKLRKVLKPRSGDPQHVINPPFPVGVLAHSHAWKAPKSRPDDNIENTLFRLDEMHAAHPRESLDFLCVADLGTWVMERVVYMPPITLTLAESFISEAIMREGGSLTSMTRHDITHMSLPVAVFLATLYEELSLKDPTLTPLADNFRHSGTIGMGGGRVRAWRLGDVYDEETIRQIRAGNFLK